MEPDQKENCEQKKNESEAVNSQDEGMTQIQSELAKVKEERDALKDQLLRTAAEYENSRKRILRDKDEAIKYANASIFEDLIPIIDNFERALSAGRQQKEGEGVDFNSFIEGIELIEGQMVSLLDSKYGLKRFEDKGQIFDPQCHEAFTVGPEEHPEDEPVVLETFQKGYKLNDRVIRSAKVRVSKEKTKK